MESFNDNYKKNLLVFEFFSGIGGMHDALSQINNINIKRIYPFDINKNANLVYIHNFKINPFNISIEGFSLKDYENLIELNIKQKPNDEDKLLILWTMSPPCQPFTRQGKVEGLNDNRTNAFVHLMNNIFMKTKYLPDYFLLENVKNFEISEANKMLIDILIQKKFSFIQFLLSPVQFNIPNSRLRFYLIASKIKQFDIKEYSSNPNSIIEDANIIFKDKILPEKDIQTFLNFGNDDDYIKNKEYYLTKEILEKKNCLSMDIALLGNKSTNCFTKGYTKLFKGTGSILLLNDKLYKSNLNPISLLGFIRFFTPNEILKFLSFSENFSFPDNLSEKTKYRLLGNSINVKVVNILMNYLLN